MTSPVRPPGGGGAPGPERRLLWAMLRGQRPWRELHYLSQMPGTRVTALGEDRPAEDVDFVATRYRQPVHRFVEAGALCWMRDLDAVRGDVDWWASLELCSLVTGQVSRSPQRRAARQAVLIWANDARTPLYRLPPYRQAVRAARSADLFLCFVHAAREHCLELGLPPERCAVVHPGVDVELFSPPTEPRQHTEPVALFVSPVAANKGVDRLLEAWPLVRGIVPEARLRIVGRGPLDGLVHRAAAADPSVEHLGPLPRERVADQLRRASVFVTAPRPTRVWNEQFGLAYVEAMATGLPVVTTICGSNDEAVVPPNVRVPDDAEALAHALAAMLADPARRAAVGAANRRHVVTHHDLRVQSRRMGDVFAAAETWEPAA